MLAGEVNEAPLDGEVMEIVGEALVAVPTVVPERVRLPQRFGLAYDWSPLSMSPCQSNCSGMPLSRSLMAKRSPITLLAEAVVVSELQGMAISMM